jgi:hypothetical protein
MQLMVGSEGKADYLVILKRGGTKLGVKPLFDVILEPSGGVIGVLIGLRLRSVFDTMGKTVILHRTPAYLTTAYPEVEFTQTNIVRASTVFHQTYALEGSVKTCLTTAPIDRWAGSLTKAILAKFGRLDIDPKDLNDFIYQKMKAVRGQHSTENHSLKNDPDTKKGNKETLILQFPT